MGGLFLLKALLAGLLLTACVGGPQPDPPVIDFGLSSLSSNSEGMVALSGTEGSANPDDALITACNLSNVEPVVETLAERGAFSIELGGESTDAFAIWASNCGVDYSPNYSVRLDVQTGYLSIDARGPECLEVTERTDAGRVEIGALSSLSVLLRNTCDSDVGYSFASSPWRVGADFQLLTGGDASLAPGEEATLSFEFRPTARGFREDILFVDTFGAEGTGQRLVVLSGTGTSSFVKTYAEGSVHRFDLPISGLADGNYLIETTSNDGETWDGYTSFPITAEFIEAYEGIYPMNWTITGSDGLGRVRLRDGEGTTLYESSSIALGPTQQDLGYEWERLTSAAEFEPRHSAGLVSLGGRLLLLGGSNNVAGTDAGAVDLLNDVWSSSDGTTWERLLEQAPWSARYASSAREFNGKALVFGGYAGPYRVSNDGWMSEDGSTWTKVGSHPWKPRYGSFTAELNNRLWFMGGVRDSGSGTFYSDVWRSCDGVTWSQQTAQAPWAERGLGASTAKDGYLWIIGGERPPTEDQGGTATYYPDVWRSDDGINWDEINNNTPWGTLASHGVATWDDKLWVVGGLGLSPNVAAWYSSDGFNWYPFTSEAQPEPRTAPSIVAREDGLYVLAGLSTATSAVLNDVWRLTDSTP